MSDFRSSKISILDIEILRFTIDEGVTSDESSEIEILSDKTDFGVNFDEKLAKIVFELELGGACKCSFKISVLFNVENIEDLVDYDRETEEVSSKDKNFYPHIFAIAYSTMRGIIYTKTLGVISGGIILPIIHPSKFYKQFLSEEEDKGKAS